MDAKAYIASLGGFLKYGYPLVIHFRLGFSIINHQFWGTSMTMETSILSDQKRNRSEVRIPQDLPQEQVGRLKQRWIQQLDDTDDYCHYSCIWGFPKRVPPNSWMGKLIWTIQNWWCGGPILAHLHILTLCISLLSMLTSKITLALVESQWRYARKTDTTNNQYMVARRCNKNERGNGRNEMILIIIIEKNQHNSNHYIILNNHTSKSNSYHFTLI